MKKMTSVIDQIKKDKTEESHIIYNRAESNPDAAQGGDLPLMTMETIDQLKVMSDEDLDEIRKQESLFEAE